MEDNNDFLKDMAKGFKHREDHYKQLYKEATIMAKKKKSKYNEVKSLLKRLRELDILSAFEETCYLNINDKMYKENNNE